jgi:hypothetical protein
MKKIFLVIILAIATFFLAFMVFKRSDSDSQQTPTPTPAVSQTPTTSPSASTTPEINMRVTSPKAGATLSLPITVTGQERTFEQGVNWQVRDRSGTVLAEGYTTGHGLDMGVWGDYSFTIAKLNKPAKGLLEIWVFEYSAKDGSIVNLVKVPIVLE